MKLLPIYLIAAAALLTVFTGCNGSGYYTPSQAAAQHQGYDPIDRLDRTRY